MHCTWAATAAAGSMCNSRAQESRVLARGSCPVLNTALTPQICPKVDALPILQRHLSPTSESAQKWSPIGLFCSLKQK